MSLLFIHYCWFMVFALVTSIFFLIASYITMVGESFFLSFDLFSSWFINIDFCLIFDLFSSWFSFSVSFISTVVIVYSYFYIMPYSKPLYFIWLTSFFVISILVLINFSNIFFSILGWDGLGLVSFFLIVYYQNFSSVYSGLFTVIMNRVGDCFFILSIGLVFLFHPFMWTYISYHSSFIIFSIVAAFMTNSAIYPFSPWLPMAMAAPTPISALVHSSTLVTAGLYLIMRFSYLIYSSSFLVNFLLVFCIFTSFYAGMNSLFEIDLKKLIALSTLSHLGFIGIALFSGLLNLSFFHLLIHAFFKSVLFIAIGDVITDMLHSQDARFLSGGGVYTPFSFYIIILSFINLLGLPSISGFFSNDLILESLNYSNFSFMVVFVVYLNLFFTYYYTYKLFSFGFSSLNVSPFLIVHGPFFLHVCSLVFLGCFSVVFGLFWINYSFSVFIVVSVPTGINVLPIFINFLVFVFLFFSIFLFIPSSSQASFFFSSIMLLSSVAMTLTSNLYLKLSFELSNTVEVGFLDNFLNKGISVSIIVLSRFFLSGISVGVIFMVMVSFIFIFIFYLV